MKTRRSRGETTKSATRDALFPKLRISTSATFEPQRDDSQPQPWAMGAFEAMHGDWWVRSRALRVANGNFPKATVALVLVGHCPWLLAENQAFWVVLVGHCPWLLTVNQCFSMVLVGYCPWAENQVFWMVLWVNYRTNHGFYPACGFIRYFIRLLTFYPTRVFIRYFIRLRFIRDETSNFIRLNFIRLNFIRLHFIRLHFIRLKFYPVAFYPRLSFRLYPVEFYPAVFYPKLASDFIRLNFIRLHFIRN